MASINEVARAFEWLYSTLSGNSGVTAAVPGGVHQGMAPVGTATPYGVFLFQAGPDVSGTAGIRLMNSGLYQVAAYAPSLQSAALAAAADAIDNALQRASGAAGSDAIVLSCVREQPLAIDELVNGTQWSRLGGFYRIQVHAL